MTAADVGRFAWGAVAGHRTRSALSLVGVAIGIVSVVLLTSLGNGARLYVTGEFSALGTNLIIVTPGKVDTTGFAPPMTSAPHDITLDDVATLQRRMPGVRHVVPLALGVVSARFGARSRDAVVTGTTADWARMRNVPLSAGQYLPEGAIDLDRAVCVVGATIQRELFPLENPLGQILRLGDERFLVIGVAAPRGTSLGMNLDEVIQIPIGRHLRMFNQRGVTRVMVEAPSAGDVELVTRQVREFFIARHDQDDDVTVITQESMMTAFANILNALTRALVAIAAISLGVAGIGIMNVMLVSVSERTREIGVLKAVGATPRQILTVFTVEAGLLTTLGGIAGLLAAFALAWIARTIFPEFPMQPPAWATATALITALVVGLGFGALPARRAAGLDPVQALSGGKRR